jgi:uroporphyrinogen-III synthase
LTPVLVLRPEPGASETVRKARGLGLHAIAIPLFAIHPVEWIAPQLEEFDALLLSSANAVRHGGDQLRQVRGLKVYAVGDATAEVARQAGFEITATGTGGVEQLLRSIPSDLRLLHLCGADRKEIAQPLQAITSIIVYRATPIDSPDLSEASGSLALVHSPRAGRRFAELMGERETIAIAAISPAAADATGGGWKSVAIAQRPTDDALLALAARLCNNPDAI